MRTRAVSYSSPFGALTRMLTETYSGPSTNASSLTRSGNVFAVSPGAKSIRPVVGVKSWTYSASPRVRYSTLAACEVSPRRTTGMSRWPAPSATV